MYPCLSVPSHAWACHYSCQLFVGPLSNIPQVRPLVLTVEDCTCTYTLAAGCIMVLSNKETMSNF